MSKKKIVIVGAGPGGLSAAMLLANQGYQVSVFEKKNIVGGRSAPLELGPYKFDTGPTFLMMTYILKELFKEVGKKLEDYCEIMPLDPMYKLSFFDKEIYSTSDKKKMQEQILKYFPGHERALDMFYRKEEKRYRLMYPCLQGDYSSLFSMMNRNLLKAFPYLSLHRSLYQNLGDYFKDDHLRIAFTFQAKYLGMSPWECPAAFTLIPYVEHQFGIDHVRGGLSSISDAMTKIVIEKGGKIYLDSPVKTVLTQGRKIIGIRLNNNEIVECDALVLNADFAHSMSELFEPGVLKKYTPEKLKNMKYSCSTFMLYLGMDRIYNEPHHNIIFAKDYRLNIEDIVKNGISSEDMSIYLRNASITDSSLAPEGHSSLYVLVPVPNNKIGGEWTEEKIREYRNRIIARIMERTTMKDLEKHIKAEKIITPKDWQTHYDVHYGATFNLAHNIMQMLYFRPRNRFEEFQNCFLVGGGTHPGSGLPTIYESARITSRLLGKHFLQK